MNPDVLRLVAAAPSRALLERLYHRIKPVAEMFRRTDDRTAVFSMPADFKARFAGHCEDLGIKCTDAVE
jgi:hypothetical protein